MRAGDQTILGSLTLGGYDASRIIPNDLTFIFAPDNERDLVVGLVGLSASVASKKEVDLLAGIGPSRRNDVTMFIDSTVAELYFPLEICQAFESAFGLQYDEATDLYLVDDALHQSLLTQNPSVTFTLGQQYSSDATVQITLPYAAFDLEASPPYRGLANKTRFFPIRRGNGSGDWVLGRTFLQEAYLTVDWERENFSLSAIDWTFGKAPEILPIVSPEYASASTKAPQKKSLASAAVIGLAVGGGFFFALVVCAIGWLFWRRRHKQSLEAIEAKHQAEVAAVTAKKMEERPLSTARSNEEQGSIFAKAELPSDMVNRQAGSSTEEKGCMIVNEADGNRFTRCLATCRSPRRQTGASCRRRNPW